MKNEIVGATGILKTLKVGIQSGLTTQLTDQETTMLGAYATKMHEAMKGQQPKNMGVVAHKLRDVIKAKHNPSDVYLINYAGELNVMPSYIALMQNDIRNNTIGIKNIEFKVVKESDTLDEIVRGDKTFFMVKSKDPFAKSSNKGILINAYDKDGNIILQGVYNYAETMEKGKAFSKASTSKAWTQTEAEMVKRSAYTNFRKTIPVDLNEESIAQKEFIQREMKEAVREEEKVIEKIEMAEAEVIKE